jgi:hypothetical protein
LAIVSTILALGQRDAISAADSVVHPAASNPRRKKSTPDPIVAAVTQLR